MLIIKHDSRCVLSTEYLSYSLSCLEQIIEYSYSHELIIDESVALHILNAKLPVVIESCGPNLSIGR